MNVYFFEKAKEHAEKNCVARKKHVSLIVQDNKIVSIGCNGFEVPSRYAFMGYRSLHSEVTALMRLNIPKVNLHLYNYRFNNQGQLKLAKPCKICMPWCEAVFDSISYTTNEGRMVTWKTSYE